MADGGILDWLTSSIGSSMGQDATGTGAMLGQTMPDVTKPPVPPGATPPSPPMVGPTGEAGDTTAALGMPGMGGSPPTPPAAPPAAPPVPDPSMTDIGGGMQAGRAPLAPAPPPTPPTIAPTPASASAPPGAPMSLAPPQPGPTMPPPPPPSSGPGGLSIIGRAMGLDRNTDRRFMNSLGSGLTGASNSWNKPGLAAFAGGAGAAVEGGNKSQDKIIDDQHKALTDAVAAVQVGDKRALMKAQTEKALADAQATMQGRGSKDSVVNSQQQLYLRAQSATNQDLNLKAAKTLADRAAAEFGSDSPQAKAARDALQKASEGVLNGHLQSLGLDPKAAAKIGKMPGMTQDNPVPKESMKSQADFDKLPPGSWFINPKDGKPLQKPMAPAPGAAAPGAAPPPVAPPAAAGAPPPAAGAPPPAAAPPTPPVPPARVASAATDDDEED